MALGASIKLVQQKRNQDERDQDVKLKPSARTTGKDAASKRVAGESLQAEEGYEVQEG